MKKLLLTAALCMGLVSCFEKGEEKGASETCTPLAVVQEKWTFSISERIEPEPDCQRRDMLAWSPDGAAVASFDNGTLVSLDPDTGEANWIVDTFQGQLRLNSIDGALVIQEEATESLHRLDPATGEVLWTFQGIRKLDKPLVAGDKAFVPTSDARFVALSLESGEELWSLQGTWRFGDPVPDGEDRVLVPAALPHKGGTSSMAMLSLDRETGEEAWHVDLRFLGPFGGDGLGMVLHSLYKAKDGMVYGSDGSQVYVVDSELRELVTTMNYGHCVSAILPGPEDTLNVLVGCGCACPAGLSNVSFVDGEIEPHWWRNFGLHDYTSITRPCMREDGGLFIGQVSVVWKLDGDTGRTIGSYYPEGHLGPYTPIVDDDGFVIVAFADGYLAKVDMDDPNAIPASSFVCTPCEEWLDEDGVTVQCLSDGSGHFPKN